jgi:hypothetical protein
MILSPIRLQSKQSIPVPDRVSTWPVAKMSPYHISECDSTLGPLWVMTLLCGFIPPTSNCFAHRTLKENYNFWNYYIKSTLITYEKSPLYHSDSSNLPHSTTFTTYLSYQYLKAKDAMQLTHSIKQQFYYLEIVTKAFVLFRNNYKVCCNNLHRNLSSSYEK